MIDAVTAAQPGVEVADSYRRWPPLVAGLVAVGVTLVGLSGASFSSDELATYSAARRSLGDLWILGQHIDGHFLPYYTFMHAWLEAGQSVWWLRLPAVIATGVAAGLIADLGRRIHSLRAGLFAAALYAMLPSVSYYGQNARPYAQAAAAAVLALWALHRAFEEPARGRRWVVYAVAVAALCCTHLFAILTLPAHLAVAAGHRRVALARMVPSLAIGSLPGVALAAIGFGEQQAISWIKMPQPKVFLALPRMVAGEDWPGYVLLVAAAAGAVLLWRGRKARPGLGAWAGALAGWALLPPLLLFAISHLVTPVYVNRYLFATAPAFALLAGLALAAVPRMIGAAVAAAVLAVTLAVSLPGQVKIREEDGHYENFPAAVRAIQGGAKSGDAILFEQTWMRDRLSYYGDLPDDVLRLDAGPMPSGFGYRERTDVASALTGRQRVWIAWRGGPETGLARSQKVKSVRDAGFALVRMWRPVQSPGVTVALFRR